MRKLALLIASVPIALGAVHVAPASAQGFWIFQPFGAQRAPSPGGGPDEYDPGRPIARPRGAPAHEGVDDHRTRAGAGSAAVDGSRATAIPADADPAYSTPINYDDQIDWRDATRTVVSDPTGEPAGTITVNTRTRKLYLSLSGGQAIEYGIGVGRQGFAWKGIASVGRKAYWPGWTPPREMLHRRPDLPSHMDGSIGNPLGARALYLFQGSRDTLFRIHGTNEPDTIGQAVSSGCIRMLNSDVIDLYHRVPKGARVVVL